MNKTTRSGFTLIETLVAVTILTLAVSGPLFTASRATVAAQNARDQIIASHLAQEGVEYVRAMRDREYLGAYFGSDVSNTAWNNFLAGGGSNAGSMASCQSPWFWCTLDPTLSMGTGSGYAVEQCSGGSSCTPLYLLSNGVYTQRSNQGGTQTPFTRAIRLVNVATDEVKVESRVTWTFHGTPYSITVTDHLRPWQ